jgi:hypothetical protein
MECAGHSGGLRISEDWLRRRSSVHPPWGSSPTGLTGPCIRSHAVSAVALSRQRRHVVPAQLGFTASRTSMGVT